MSLAMLAVPGAEYTRSGACAVSWRVDAMRAAFPDTRRGERHADEPDQRVQPGTRSASGRPRRTRRVEEGGTVSERAATGDGPRRLQRPRPGQSACAPGERFKV